VQRNEEARRNLDEALTLSQQEGDKTMESLALMNLGNLESDSGRLGQALEYHRRSLDIEWDRDEQTELAIRLNTIGEVFRRQGLFADALVYVELAKDYLERSEDLKNKALNRLVLGRIEKSRGNYRPAQQALLETLQLFQQISANADAAKTHVIIAGLYVDQGRFEEALQAVQAAALLVDTDHKKMTDVDLARADVFLNIGDAARASAELDRASRSLDSAEDAERLAYRLLRASILQLSGSAPGLSSELEEIARTASALELTELRLKATVELGRLYLEQGAVDQSVAVLVRARGEAVERRLRPVQAAASLALAKALLRFGRTDDARRYASETVALAEHFEGRPLIAEGISLLGEIATSGGQTAEAAALRQKAREIAVSVLAQTPRELSHALAARYSWAHDAAK